MNNLGTANSWAQTPDVVTKCLELKHLVSEVCLNSTGTYHQITCTICGYTYKVDSSD